MARDWRNGVTSEGSDGSIFDADLYCGGCTDEICAELDKDGKKPEDVNDQSSYDSDEYPKRTDLENEESDSPQHCGMHEKCVNAIKLPCGSKIGAWLGGSLTSDGIESVIESIRSDLTRTDVHARQVGRLWRWLYRDWFDDSRYTDPVEAYSSVNVQIKNFLKRNVYVDLDAIYVVGRTKNKNPSIIEVLRFEVDPDGVAGEPETIETPAEDWKGQKPEDVL